MSGAKGQPAEAEGPPLSELESLQLNINQTTDESLDSTRRMKAMCEEAKDSGIKTLVSEICRPDFFLGFFGRSPFYFRTLFVNKESLDYQQIRFSVLHVSKSAYVYRDISKVGSRVQSLAA